MKQVVWKGRRRFKRKDGYGVLDLEAEIKETRGIDFRNPQSQRKPMKTLSISGSIGDRSGRVGRFGFHSFGQVLDDVNPNEYESSRDLARILEIWRRYHLNDLQSGTINQMQTLSNWRNRPSNWSYDEDRDYLSKKGLIKDQGYEFGTGWLTEQLPVSIQKEIKRLF